MGSIFDKIGKPGLVIIGEIVDSLRFKKVSSPTTATGIFPVGQAGYNPADFPSGAPTNLNASGFYEVKNINIGITDVESAIELIRSSATNSTFTSYNNLSMVSLDGLFVPYSTDPTHSELPHFEEPETDNKPNVNTLNPFNLDNSLESGVLNTGFPAGIEGRWLQYGHNIGLSLSKTTSDTGVTDLNFEKDYNNTGKVEYNTVRSVAFRNPLILSGPGYSTSGLPVPASGSGEFHPEAFWNPTLWKTGPLDVRWDDSKKVWMPKPYYKIRFQIHESDCESSSAVVKILSRSEGVSSVPEEYEIENSGTSQCYNEQNENGDTVCSKFVQVYDKIGAFFNESNINLSGRLGYAEYLYGHPYVNTQPWLCWEVTGLAEQQTECESI